MAYDLYPAVDENLDFVQDIRERLRISLELRNQVVPMTTAVRDSLIPSELWADRLILNTDIDQIERYDLATTTWITGDPALAAHIANADPHPQYMTQAEGDALYRPLSAPAGHTIQEEGTPLTTRTGLNFVGAGVTATDDEANNRTNVEILATPAPNEVVIDPAQPSGTEWKLWVDNDEVAQAPMTQDQADARYLMSGFRNVIRNGDMSIAQRGNGPWTGSGSITADGFRLDYGGGTTSVSRAATAAGVPALLQTTVSGQSMASHYVQINHVVETPAPWTGGQTVILSFMAKAASGTPMIGLRYTLAGDSDYASYMDIPVGKVTLSTTLQRYSVPFVLPTNTTTMGPTSVLKVTFWLSSGANHAGIFNVGLQNNTFSITDVQLEEGTTATPFERLPVQQQLAWCQRYYYASTYIVMHVHPYNSGNALGNQIPFPVLMRVAPTIVFRDMADASGKVSYSDNGGSMNNGIAPPAGLSILPEYWHFSSGGIGTGSIGIIRVHFTASAEL